MRRCDPNTAFTATSVDPRRAPSSPCRASHRAAVSTARRWRGALLDHVIADAPARGAAWIEGYPHNAPQADDAAHFRGPRSMYDARGFEAIERLERYTVMRRAVAR